MDQKMQRHHMRAILGTGLLVIIASLVIMWLMGEANKDVPIPQEVVRSTGWEKYGSDEDGDHSFRMDEPGPPSPGIVRVWNRLVFSERGKEKYIALRRNAGLPIAGYDQLVQRNVLYEINCYSAKKEIRIVEVVELAADDKTLDYAKAGSYKDWTDVQPGTIFEQLCSRVCPERRQ
jgi:hypothetical protein